jgi:heptosyltransferase-1
MRFTQWTKTWRLLNICDALPMPVISGYAPARRRGAELANFWRNPERKAWAELADMLTEKAGAPVIFAGGPGDLSLIEKIAALMKQKALVAAGRLNLAEAAALMELCSVYVGVDSGPMHIAAFAGIPVVALFGPTDPAKVGPYGPGHKVIQKTGLDCLACRKRRCDDPKCLEGITASEAFDETVRLLGWR